ncbi:MAG: GTP cyclohydrolase I [Methanobrevibacter sp.]|nr:GTP cyclohydrolase I [Methanobrevibacter sp.]
MKIDTEFIEKKIEEILEKGMGLKDWKNNVHLKETPKRVAKVYSELYSGYNDNLEKYFKVFNFHKTDKKKQIITIGPIKVYSMCSHHMLPFNMNIFIGYIPDKKIIGISKLVRLSKSICRKLQVQENITKEILNIINEKLSPKGVIVLINNSTHTCMSMRGVEMSSNVSTRSVTGLFEEDIFEDKFLKIINQK